MAFNRLNLWSILRMLGAGDTSGTLPAKTPIAMFDAIKKADAGYAAFAARLAAELEAEYADIARHDARTSLYRSETADCEASTVRPTK